MQVGPWVVGGEISPELGHLVQVHGLFESVQRDHDRQAHSGLRGGHQDHEHGEDGPEEVETVGPRVHPGAGQEAQVGGVEQELHAGQHHDHVAAQKETQHAQSEEDCGEHKHVFGGDVHGVRVG